MVDQDKLADLIDGVVSQHYPYITEGQMAPHWLARMADPDHLYRHYNMKSGDGEKPYVGLAIPLLHDEQLASEGEIKDIVKQKLNEVGPMPSKAEWEAKN